MEERRHLTTRHRFAGAVLVVDRRVTPESYPSRSQLVDVEPQHRLIVTGMANEAVLPVYVIHQTVIVAIAYLVVSYPVAAGLKYLILATSALLVTLMLFQLVRRTPATRFLFGMKANIDGGPDNVEGGIR